MENQISASQETTLPVLAAGKLLVTQNRRPRGHPFHDHFNLRPSINYFISHLYEHLILICCTFQLDPVKPGLVYKEPCYKLLGE